MRNPAAVSRVLKGLKVQTAYLILNNDVDLNRSVSVSALSSQQHEEREKVDKEIYILLERSKGLYTCHSISTSFNISKLCKVA